jgi:hypothetical protein
MINEQEKRNTLNKMSDLEYQKNDVEMMRYRSNGLSHKLGIFAMMFSLLGCFICLNSMKPSDIQVLIIIMINIVILLGGFLAAERAKTYSFKGSIALIVFGGICVGRMFYMPLSLITNYNAYVGMLADQTTYTSISTKLKSGAELVTTEQEVLDKLVETAQKAAQGTEVDPATVIDDALKTVGASIKTMRGSVLGETITYKDGSNVAIAFLPSDGNFRGISAMILFAIAAALFITAGVIGVLRARKLSNYLDSLKAKN